MIRLDCSGALCYNTPANRITKEPAHEKEHDPYNDCGAGAGGAAARRLRQESEDGGDYSNFDAKEAEKIHNNLYEEMSKVLRRKRVE